MPRGHYSFGLFSWLILFTISQFKRLVFTLSPAAAGALPEGEPWGGFLFYFGLFFLRLVSLGVWFHAHAARTLFFWFIFPAYSFCN